MIDETTINNRYNAAYYVNNPCVSADHHIRIIVQCDYGSVCKPLVSIIMPVHNQVEIVVQHLKAILENTIDMMYELIIILDSCSDGTEAAVLRFYESELISNDGYPCVTNVLLLQSDTPLFETCADNIGFFCSSAPYSLEIQADMQMTDRGYNTRLMVPFLQRDDIIGVSGRCCHTFCQTAGIGKLGTHVETPLSQLPHIDTSCWYESETCNRGPLLLDNAKLRKLGFLDEVNYFLDDSDHDLFARAFAQHGWACGYVPINFNAYLFHGSTRKPRNAINQKYYELNKKTKTGNGFLKRYLSELHPVRSLVKHAL